VTLFPREVSPSSCLTQSSLLELFYFSFFSASSVESCLDWFEAGKLFLIDFDTCLALSRDVFIRPD